MSRKNLAISEGDTMQETVTGKELFSVRDLSNKTGLCDRTFYRLIKAGKIKTLRLGASVMIPKSEFLRIIERGF